MRSSWLAFHGVGGDIADHAGISPYYLERVFKQETDETPRTYLEKIRVDKAAYLLTSTDRTNLEICYDQSCGSAKYLKEDS